MKVHKLKIEPQYYDALLLGIKTFEIRKNDRDFKVGDILKLSEYKDGYYTGGSHRAKIIYITDYAQQEGYVVMGIEPAEGKKLTIPEHLATNLLNYDSYLETEDSIDQFMFDVYDTYEAESYVTYDAIKAYLNPLTRQYVTVEEDSQ